MPLHPAIGDDEDLEEDDDVAESDYVPTTSDLNTTGSKDKGPLAKNKCMQPAVEIVEDEDDVDDDDTVEPAPQAKEPTANMKAATRWTLW